MKRVISLIALILLLSFISNIFISCKSSTSGNNDKTTTGQNASVNTSTTTAADDRDEKYISNLPAADFGGKELKLLINVYGGTAGTDNDICVEESSADIIKDAVYKRNTNMQVKYNFKITPIYREYTDTLGQLITRDVSAGLRSYDAAFLTMNQTSTIVSSNVLMDLNKVPNINLDKYYWDQSVRKQLSFGDKLFYDVSDISVSSMDQTYLLLYNKKLIEEYNVEPLYPLVFSGKWTLDKFNSIIKDKSHNLTGGDKLGTKDFWGFSADDEMYYALFCGSGERLTVKDANNMPVLVTPTERMSKAIEIIGEIMKQNNSTYNANLFYKDEPDWETNWPSIPVFREDRALFFGNYISTMSGFRNMQSDFGVLPVPKLDENQENYNTYAYQLGVVASIPNNLSDEDLSFVGFTLEALSEESRKLLVPAYYDTTLKVKYSRDDESSQILDMVFQNRTFDPMYLYDFGGFMTAFRSLLRDGKSNVTSLFEKNGPKAESAIQKLVDALNK